MTSWPPPLRSSTSPAPPSGCPTPTRCTSPARGERRHEAPPRGVLPDDRHAGGHAARARAAEPPDVPAALPRRRRGRGGLPEAAAAEGARARPVVPRHVPLGPARRRAQGDQPGRRRLGREPRHRHLPSVARDLLRRRAPGPAADRPRPPARYRVPDAAGVAAGRRPSAARRSWATSAIPKTSGGRGLHVFVRSSRSGPSPRSAARPSPSPGRSSAAAGGRVTTAWWKEQRGEQVFVDYNQNARDRTIASAYSARRTPRATVSTPLTLGRARRRRPRRLHHRHRSGARRPAGRPDGGDRRRSRHSSIRCSSSPSATRPAAWATCPTRRTTRRCPASRSGCMPSSRGPTPWGSAAGRPGAARRGLRPCHPGRSLA